MPAERPVVAGATWDGLEIAADHPHGSTVVVRRPGVDTGAGAAGHEYLVLHRAGEGAGYEGDWAWTAPAGARQPGEAVYPAALRELREEAGLVEADVWAVDLSGRWAVFGCDVPAGVEVTLHDAEHDRFEWLDAAAAAARILPVEVSRTQVGLLDTIPRAAIRFRPMTRADFPDVVRWQAEPHVRRWWSDEAPDVAGAERHYGPALDGDDPTRMWVLEVDGRPVGFVQDYLIGDHPEYAALMGRPDAVGFDYAIGDPALVGRRLGTRMLWAFLRDVVRPHYPDAPSYYAAPDHRNAGSLRVLDKLGFRRGLWFDEPQPDGRVTTVVGCTLDAARMFGPPPR
ncbi:MAG: GNAT family N-acetyltransferase [Nocardioidaceae bacterium]